MGFEACFPGPVSLALAVRLAPHRLRFAPSDAVRPDGKLTASALFRPHHWPDSSAFRPLHSLPRPASQATRTLSLIPTAANCRDRHRQRCAQNCKTTQAAMLRISAKTGNMAARLRPARWVQAMPANSREHGAFAPASQNTPTSLTRPSWSETSSSGCGRCCRARPCTHRVAALALRSAVEDSESLAGAIATAPGGR